MRREMAIDGEWFHGQATLEEEGASSCERDDT